MADVVATLERLIRVDTHNPGGDERALARLLAAELQQRGPDEVRLSEVPRDNETGAWVMARWGTPKVLVNAHLDTVPAAPGWTGNPHEPRRVSKIDGDRILGLGACDTKGAIAAILAALDDAPPRDLAVLFSGDEERSGSCMRDFLDSDAAKGIVRAIVCEPTSCRIGTRHRGILSLSVQRTGPGGHSSRADETAAPLADLARLATAWDDWGRRHRELGPLGFRGMCLNIARLDGGVAFNVIPSRAELVVSLRPPPGTDVRAVRAELEAMARAQLPDLTLTTTVENAPFATRDLESFRPLLGDLVSKPIDLAFWTEAAMLSEAGIDAVVFGPGDIALAHGADESVPVPELERARAVFARLFKTTAGDAAG
jgi:acetylornithine deacetylase